MARQVFTTTISLPKTMAADLKLMRKREGRTTSELVREALRHYQRKQHREITAVSWKTLRAKVLAVSRAGRQRDLAKFIAHDRLSH